MSVLWSICLLHFFAQLSPGPDVLLIAKSSVANSKWQTLQIILGISLGIAVWVGLTLSGLAALILQFPWIQSLLMLVGGLFLARMGLLMLQSGWQMRQSAMPTLSAKQNLASHNYFLLGLLTNLSNPKTLIYFASVFSLMLASGASSALKYQLLWIIPVQTGVTFVVLMLLLSNPRMKKLYQHAGAYIDIVSGALFCIFALLLWGDVLHTLLK